MGNRALEAEVERLKEATLRFFEGRASVHDVHFRDWLKHAEAPPWLALYPTDSPERAVERSIQNRMMVLAKSGATMREPPPEFMVDRSDGERIMGWIVASDPELAELMGQSDLSERMRRVVAGETPEPEGPDAGDDDAEADADPTPGGDP